MKYLRYSVTCYCIYLIAIISILGCSKDDFSDDGSVDNNPVKETPDTIDYSQIPQSDIYEVSIIKVNIEEKQIVFKSTCPEFHLGKDGMIENYKFALGPYAGRSISWSNFSFKGSVQVEVKVSSQSMLALNGGVNILPSRFGVVPKVSGNTIRFTIDNPGQFSVEIGTNGYKHLMIFADPEETDIPNPKAWI